MNLCHFYSFTEMNFIIYDMSELIMGVVRIMTWILFLIVLHIDKIVCSVYFSLL